MSSRSESGWRVPLIARVGSLMLRLLGLTWRIRVVGDADFKRLRDGGLPVVLVLWHGQMLPCLYHHRGQRIAILISEHRDGEIIAQIAERFGLRTVRGSTSRGGGRALIEAKRTLESGYQVAITPDGPRGPAGSFAAGAVIAAHRAGVGVLPMAASARSAWRLRTWDGFMIPKPFTRVTIAYGPVEYPAGSTPREVAEETPRFSRYLVEASQRASD